MATIINLVRRAEANIKVYKGDTNTFTLSFTDANGDPLDFTGVTFKMQIRDSTTNALLQELLQGTAMTVTLPNTVVFDVVITIAAGTYDYDLQGTYSNLDVITFLGGKFEVLKEVTV